MSAFWEENIRAVIGLFRAELADIEAGVYKARFVACVCEAAPAPAMRFGLAPAR